MSEVIALLAADFRMWVTFALIVGALILYALERLPVEATSVVVLCVLMLFFQAFPVAGPDGGNVLDPGRLLGGFSNPALITVLALLVIGQGMVRTGVLDQVARLVLRLGRGHAGLSIGIALGVVVALSAILNNIPVVVIFIPIMQALADRLGRPVSRVMMGLSFTAVLGGSTTLIGSGSNLLVSGALQQAGETPFGFFDFTAPGLVLAGVGLVYVLWVMPWLLPARESLAQRIMSRSGRYFVAQIAITPEHPLCGTKAVGGVLEGLADARVRMIVRGERVMLPPFHDFVLEDGDMVVVAASRKALAEAVSRDPRLFHPAAPPVPEPPPRRDGDSESEERDTQVGERVLAEVMVAPASRLAGQRLNQTGFQFRTRCLVLGIQRRARMFRSSISDVPLAEGDVLLVQGRPADIKALRRERDVVLMEWSTEELPVLRSAPRTIAIFAAVVGAAASGLVPVVVAAVTGAAAMVVFGTLNVRQAARALDSKVFTMIPATLALGAAMQDTGGAAWLAHNFVTLLHGLGPTVVLSGFFLLAAVLGNVISSNATAVLFTPIAIGLGREVGIDPHVFAIAVVLAANCTFATPIGYQTSLLVMGPGHYRFVDFPRAGAPLVLLLWIAFTLFVPWYYGV